MVAVAIVAVVAVVAIVAIVAIVAVVAIVAIVMTKTSVFFNHRYTGLLDTNVLLGAGTCFSLKFSLEIFFLVRDGDGRGKRMAGFCCLHG